VVSDINSFFKSRASGLNEHLFLKFTEETFWIYHLHHLFQASFMNKKINIGGKKVNLSIWDTAGQERFHALGPIYYRMSNGAILVYDITDEDSFQKVCCNITIERK
jgi:Ras-related protein Rab-21